MQSGYSEIAGMVYEQRLQTNAGELNLTIK
jgi:hypothetical protein